MSTNNLQERDNYQNYHNYAPSFSHDLSYFPCQTQPKHSLELCKFSLLLWVIANKYPHGILFIYISSNWFPTGKTASIILLTSRHPQIIDKISFDKNCENGLSEVLVLIPFSERTSTKKLFINVISNVNLTAANIKSGRVVLLLYSWILKKKKHQILLLFARGQKII